MGHSSAGVFAVYALLQRPDMFKGYAAISPAIDRDYEPLIDSTPFFASHRDLRDDVFITIGNVRERSARLGPCPARTHVEGVAIKAETSATPFKPRDSHDRSSRKL